MKFDWNECNSKGAIKNVTTIFDVYAASFSIYTF